jgi:hypothetical protein
MFISFVHPNGKTYLLPVSQVVVYAQDGQPAALAYEHAGLIIHSNVGQPGFAGQTAQLKIKPVTPPESVPQ